MFTEPHIQADKKGWAEVICGPMFSGKTEELIRRIRRAQIANKSIGIFKPTFDERYHRSNIVSHNDTNIPSVPVKSSKEILEQAVGKEVVAIDEAQFFDEDLNQVIDHLALAGTRVIVAGLDMDFLGHPFGPMPQILAKAEYVTKLQAICMVCGNPASFSFRKAASTDTLLLGATDVYEARCRNCFALGLELS